VAEDATARSVLAEVFRRIMQYKVRHAWEGACLFDRVPRVGCPLRNAAM
jgi:hypothetical protein